MYIHTYTDNPPHAPQFVTRTLGSVYVLIHEKIRESNRLYLRLFLTKDNTSWDILGGGWVGSLLNKCSDSLAWLVLSDWTLLFDLYHYLEQNGYFWLIPEHAAGPSSQVLPGCRVRHPCYSRKLFVRTGLVRFKVGYGISQKNTDSQWNPIYKAFHWICCCGNETIRQ